MHNIRKWIGEMNTRRVKTNLLFIVVAAILLELISGYQYYYSHHLLEKELEHRAESELHKKASFLNNSRAMFESALTNGMWDFEYYLAEPDSMYGVAEWIVQYSPHVVCAGIAFTPYFYPEKGRLFEPYAVRKDGEIVFEQLGNDAHDYTTGEIYNHVMTNDEEYWSRPYFDSIATNLRLITYCVPMHGKVTSSGQSKGSDVIAMLGLDIETSFLSDTLNSNNPYPSSFVLLVNREGDVIAGPDTTLATEACVKRVLELLKNHAGAEPVLHVECEEFRDPDDGEKGYVFYSDMKGNAGWRMAVVCYDDEVFGPLKRMRLLVFMLMLLALVVLTFVILRFVHNDISLERTQAEKDRMNNELRVASEIQQSMLPHHKLHLEEVDIYGRLVPAREVGGDLYDYVVRDEKLFFCIGDVSGKGAPSAMLMAVIHSLFRSASARETNPARIIRNINEALAEGNEKNMFATLFVGVLDLPTGRLRYCNAGHDAPVVLGKDSWSMIDVEANLPVGVFDDTKYMQQEMTLAADSMLFLYTDGLTEAKNAEHKLYGMERMQSLMARCAQQGVSSKQMIEAATKSVHSFVDGAEPSDDLTMLAIHYTPALFNITLSEKITLKNDVREVERFSTFIKGVSDHLGVSPTLAGKLRLATEEALVNVMDYAYPPGTEGDIDILVQSDGKTLRVVISDAGVAFDPTSIEKADTSLTVEERPIGGLGILLVRELMDSINYERAKGRNVLTLIKCITEDA